MGSIRLICSPALALLACGTVETDLDAAGTGIDGTGTTTDGAIVDGPDVDAATDAPTDACVPFLGVTAQFTVNAIYGTGASSLDVLLNHANGLIINFSNHMIVRGIENNGGGGSVLKTAAKSTSWAADYTGQDGNVLDTELGQFLTVGGAYMQSIFDLGDNRVYLYILPPDTPTHPYMAFNCYNAGLATDGNGFPILDTHTYTGCTTTFYDFRPPTQKNINAENNTTLEITYRPCP